MSRTVASVTGVYARFAAPGSGSRATSENSETASVDPVFLTADVKARNALLTFPAKLATDPDSSRIIWMSIPQPACSSGLGAIGRGGSPGAAVAVVGTTMPLSRIDAKVATAAASRRLR